MLEYAINDLNHSHLNLCLKHCKLPPLNIAQDLGFPVRLRGCLTWRSVQLSCLSLYVVP